MAPSRRKRVQAMEIEPVTNVAEVYCHIIDEVIHEVWKNLRDEFLMEGIEKADLTQLRQSWETNLRKSGAVEFTTADEQGVPALTIVGNASTQAHAQVIDLNVPYGGTDEHHTHKMHPLSSFEPQTMTTTTAVTPLLNTQAHVDATPLPMQTPAPVFIAGREPNMLHNCVSRGPGESSNGTRGWLHLDDEHGRQASNMREPAPSMHHNGSGFDVDINKHPSFANFGQEERESGHGQKRKMQEDQEPSTRLSTTLNLS